ncbi:MAG: CRTAC1 family protein [Phycisphaerae bacterium]|nr:CRTAC1 family protein [Phycisphaerae bacterium]
MIATHKLVGAVAVVCALSLSVAASAQVSFTDVTAASGINMTHAPKPAAVPGFNEWTLAGVCVLDANNDGWPDLFALRGGNGADGLFLNNGDGTFSSASPRTGLIQVHAGAGCSVGDFNRDGYPDIYVTSYGNSSNNFGEIGKNRLYRNNGDGTFVEVAVAAGVNVTSSIQSSGNGSSWGDYDLDGDLDLAVSAWSASAAGNRLFRNNGDGTFTDVTGVAIQIPTLTWGFQTSFVDLSGDGYPELLLSADFKTSRLFRNNQDGTFTDVTTEWGAGKDKNGMGQCVLDYDNDGDMDWYVSAIYQDIPSDPTWLNGHAFYRNQGNGMLDQICETNGTQDAGWGWGMVAADFDQDGFVDIATMNGRNAGEWANEEEYFFYNNGDGTFTRDMTVSQQFLAADGRTPVLIDFDRDGDMDLAMYYNAGPLKLYRNDSPHQGRWLQVELRPGSNPYVAPFGYGTTVVARVGTKKYTRYLDGGNGYLGSSELILHFGLDDATIISDVTVHWPRGRVTTLTNVAVNQRLTIEAPALADLDSNGTIGASDLGLLLGAWGPRTNATLDFDLDNDGVVGPADLGILLGSWTP